MKKTTPDKSVAGLLPLYLKLYDDVRPQTRPVVEKFAAAVAKGLAKQGLKVVTAPVCRVEREFAAAVRQLERAKVDALVTLHLAYSPSLESVGPLSATALPVVMLDTTPDAAFGRGVDPARIMFNHGVHGLQDLANVLRRRGKAFEIVAGHWQKSDVLARCAGLVRAARAAKRLAGMKVLRVGEAFKGMGDFAVPEKRLAELLGLAVTTIAPAELAGPAGRVRERDLADELRRDRRAFVVEAPEEVHRRSARLGLGLRAVLARGGYGAFSMNFLAFDSAEPPVDNVPFLEASKAMARGTGYAGEGDVLTAALVGALLAGWEQSSFTEIFCPDWKGGSLFLSHMGEINPRCAAGRPLLHEKAWSFSAAKSPASLACAPAPGPATLVNLAPGPGETLMLIVAPVKIRGDAKHPGMRTAVRGWIRPAMPVAEFLEEYSRHGGTHHSALVPGASAGALVAFARLAGLPWVQLG